MFESRTSYYGERRPSMILIHGTEVNDEQSRAILEGRTEHQGSSHYYIDDKGEIVQYLDESKRAWHAGKGYWAGFTDINSMSVGIELLAISKNRKFNDADTFYTEPQIKALIGLAKDIASRHGIAPWHIVGHQDIACNRDNEPVPHESVEKAWAAPTIGSEKKYDPGPFFPWDKLAANGVGIWHDLKATDKDDIVTDQIIIEHFVKQLGLLGYDTRRSKDRVAFTGIMQAFQTHFLPWNICGQITEQSVKALDILLEKKFAL